MSDGYKAQMAHAKAVTKKKTTYDDAPDSPHHTPITGRAGGGGAGANGDSDDDEDGAGGGANPPPKKKKKLKTPTSLHNTSSASGAAGAAAAADGDASDSGGGGSAAEIEIVFKLHPKVTASSAGASGGSDRLRALAVEGMKDNATRFIKTTSRALIEHLCKYLAMRISLDLPPTIKKEGGNDPSGSSSSSQHSLVKDLVIYVAPSPGNIVELQGNMMLSEVNERYWKVNKPMEMLYSFELA